MKLPMKWKLREETQRLSSWAGKQFGIWMKGRIQQRRKIKSGEWDRRKKKKKSGGVPEAKWRKND